MSRDPLEVEMQQIVSRILMLHGMLSMKSGQIVLHVHEELFQRVEINQVFRPEKPKPLTASGK